MNAGSRDQLNLVIVGHVDHGKSTIIGRLLADTQSLPTGKLEQVRALCERTGKPFEYAFLLDALRDERDQGITIDAARVFFRTASRDYQIIDAPGHIEFLRNMITGAARADAALLVIDAREGIQENSRRHGYLMAMLGVRQLVVLVNKMDLVDYDAAAFDRITDEYQAFLRRIDVRPVGFIPVSGRDGANIVDRSGEMPWYTGPTVLEAADRFASSQAEVDGPFRMPVQGVYKFTGRGDNRRIVAGTVTTGRARVGDEVVFYPSGKKSVIRSFEAFARSAPAAVQAGEAMAMTLTEQIYVARGDVATLARDQRPAVSSRFRVSLFWLGRQPLVLGREYVFRIGSARAPMRIEAITRVIDASDLGADDDRSHVDRHEVADCVIELGRAVAVDVAGGPASAETGRFVIVDDYEISGGGIVREALPDRHAALREKVMLRNAKWEPSVIGSDRRAARFAQRAALVLVTGPQEADRKRFARRLESSLFDAGHLVYFLGIGNVLYGVDADIERTRENRREHIRRLAEVANLLLDAGMILIVTASELTGEDLDLVRVAVDPGRIRSVWIGEPAGTDFEYDLHVPAGEEDARGVAEAEALLAREGLLGPTGADGPAPEPPMVIWLTGLSGSGKSTLADWLAARLGAGGVRSVERLDGDAMRDRLPGTGFSRADRDAHIRRAGYLASRLEHHGVTVVASFVSPYRESREFVRGLCRRFVEVHVATPLDECERRDVKGLYARARRGEARQVTGVDDPYEPPDNPSIRVDTTGRTVDDVGAEILATLAGLAGTEAR